MPEWERVSALSIFLLALLVTAVVAALYVGGRMVMAPRPVLALAAPFDLVGRNATLSLDARDPTGLRSLKVTIRQGDKEQIVADETYQPPRKEAHFEWRPGKQARFPLREGPGRLRVEARNASWGHFFQGKTAALEKEFTARLTPPRVEVLTSQHYVNQGGCDMVVYRVTPPGAESGVQAGDAWFKGFPMPGARDPAVRFAIFAFPYDAPAATPVHVKARDEAGNEVVANFSLKVFPRSFRTRTLPIDDAFLGKVVPEILSHTPSLTDQGDLLKNYLDINRALRAANNKALAEMAGRSQPRLAVAGALPSARQLTGRGQLRRPSPLRLQGARGGQAGPPRLRPRHHRARFRLRVERRRGPARRLLRDLREHDRDRPRLRPAHGVRPPGQLRGQGGRRRQERTGHRPERFDGPGRGRHLHFSVILQGEQVDAREWWDGHWIQDRILSKMREFGGDSADAAASSKT